MHAGCEFHGTHDDLSTENERAATTDSSQTRSGNGTLLPAYLLTRLRLLSPHHRPRRSPHNTPRTQHAHCRQHRHRPGSAADHTRPGLRPSAGRDPSHTPQLNRRPAVSSRQSPRYYRKYTDRTGPPNILRVRIFTVNTWMTKNSAKDFAYSLHASTHNKS